MDLMMVVASGIGAGIVGGIFSVILFKLNRKAAKEDKQACFSAGVRVLLYDRIKHLGRTYISRGEISVEDLEDIVNMHKVYHDDLNGNGFLDNVMKQVHALPLKSEIDTNYKAYVKFLRDNAQVENVISQVSNLQTRTEEVQTP